MIMRNFLEDSEIGLTGDFSFSLLITIVYTISIQKLNSMHNISTLRSFFDHFRV